MPQKQFQAQSKKLLDLMIHSIYTHKEIFLRELISNASDAMDKLYYASLKDGNTGLDRGEFRIRIEPDAAARTLTITDNGVGMTEQDMDENLGTIAKSGSLEFKQSHKPEGEEAATSEDIDIIGQFGVGFYSAFMVAKKVVVTSRAYGSEQAFRWESEGAEGYDLAPAEKAAHGTEIVLYLKEDGEDERYSDFLDRYRLENLVKKYSDYIRYPIVMEVEQSRKAPDSTEEDPKWEDYLEEKTLNSMVPMWKKNKSELKAEDYDSFYMQHFQDYQKPAKVIHSSTEGASTYNALLFVPAHAPMHFYSREYEKGLQLYASGVMIMEKCPELLPDCFSFVRGLVDSQDLSLNISREMLQHDRQLKRIGERLEKKIGSELKSMLEKDREAYETFFKEFGLQLKYGLYENYGAKKDLLQDLLLFYSSTEKKMVTLHEYVGRMRENQKYIYYAVGRSKEAIEVLPQAEKVRDSGYELLYFTDDVDEFAMRMLGKFEDKELRSVSDKDLGLESAEETEAVKALAEESKGLLEKVKAALGEKVSEVRLTGRLKNHPACLVSDGGVSLDMERVLNSMPGAKQMNVGRALELNGGHPVFKVMQEKLAQGDEVTVEKYAKLLYDQSLLVEGLPLEDPLAFANAVCDLMI